MKPVNTSGLINKNRLNFTQIIFSNIIVHTVHIIWPFIDKIDIIKNLKIKK